MRVLVHPPVDRFVFPPVIQIFRTDCSGQARRLCQIKTEQRAWPWLGALSGAAVWDETETASPTAFCSHQGTNPVNAPIEGTVEVLIVGNGSSPPGLMVESTGLDGRGLARVPLSLGDVASRGGP